MSGYSKLDVPPPDWRITCFFVDRDHRKEGVSKAALQGALRIIASKGGRDGRRMSNRHARKAILKLILVGEHTQCSPSSDSVHSVHSEQANGSCEEWSVADDIIHANAKVIRLMYR